METKVEAGGASNEGNDAESPATGGKAGSGEEEEEEASIPPDIAWKQALADEFGPDSLLLHSTGLKWGLRALWPALRSRGFDPDDAWRQIRRIAALVLAAIAPILSHEYCTAAPGGGAARTAAN